MYDKSRELRKLSTILRFAGESVRDYPRILQKEVDWLRSYVLDDRISQTEQQKGVVEHLEQLPELLKKLKDGARREDMKEVYERLIATIAMEEFGFFTLLEVWRHWDRSKEVIHSLAESVIFLEEAVRRVTVAPSSVSAPDESTAAGRFEAKVDEILPKPRITPEDYEVLLRELEAVVREWREAAIAPKNRQLLVDRFRDAEGWITELYVLSLLDS